MASGATGAVERPAGEGGADVVFWQSDSDKRRVFAVVRRDGEVYAYGPLGADEVARGYYTDRWHIAGRGPGDQELAADLRRRAGEFHDLGDYFRCFGGDELAAWAASTPRERGPGYPGRTVEEVAARLALDEAARRALRDAALAESVAQDLDPAGDPVFYTDFRLGNWAIDAPGGGLRVDPTNYRFKAWLSFHT